MLKVSSSRSRTIVNVRVRSCTTCSIRSLRASSSSSLASGNCSRLRCFLPRFDTQDLGSLGELAARANGAKKRFGGGIKQGGEAFATGCGDRQNLLSASLHRLRESRISLSRDREIHFVGGDDLRLSSQRWAVVRQFAIDRLPVLDWRALRSLRRKVHQVDQNPAPLDVAKKLIAQACSFARSFDQPWNVSHHERPTVLVLNHSQVGDERGERISRNLRPSTGHSGNERALARIGKPDQTDVRQQLELQHQLALLSRD